MALTFVFEDKWEAVEHNLERSLKYEKSAETMYRLTQVSLKLKKKSNARKWSSMAEKKFPDDLYTILAKVDMSLADDKKTQAMRAIKKAVSAHPQSCDVLMSFVKVNWMMGYDKPVRSNAQYVTDLCPDMEMAYFYLGMVAHRFYDKKEAKKQFKRYKKYGGNMLIVPEAYR
ncbi:tetratricopeptide repeat protein [Fibrobacterota bacterium]